MTDQISRFLFDDAAIRGEHVQLADSYREVLAAHHYPPTVRTLLGEFLAAASLLAETIKFDGTLTLQARSDGEVPLIMAEASSGHKLRAIARLAGEAMSEDFGRLLAGGQLCITIDPVGGRRYQGIVALDGASLAHCLESYFRQSEQLATRVWLAADGERAGGLLLQQLPDVAGDSDYWQHVTELANTVRGEELLTLDSETLLYRLYHQETLRLFEPSALEFHCSCSRERLAGALATLDRSELDAAVAEQGAVELTCEFCNRQYHFSAAEIEAIFTPSSPGTRH